MTYGIRPKGPSNRFNPRENKIPSISLLLDFKDNLPQKFANYIVYISWHVIRYTSPSPDNFNVSFLFPLPSFPLSFFRSLSVLKNNKIICNALSNCKYNALNMYAGSGQLFKQLKATMYLTTTRRLQMVHLVIHILYQSVLYLPTVM